MHLPAGGMIFMWVSVPLSSPVPLAQPPPHITDRDSKDPGSTSSLPWAPKPHRLGNSSNQVRLAPPTLS